MDAQIVLGFEGRAYHVRDFYASQLLSMILGGGMSSRLFQEVREKRGLCYSVYAFHWGFSDTGIFGVHAATGQGDIAKLVPVILDELRKAGENILDEELNRARAQYRAGLLMSSESAASRASQIARQICSTAVPCRWTNWSTASSKHHHRAPVGPCRAAVLDEADGRGNRPDRQARLL
jgi:predicted Zn-dependent peptidase